MIDPDLVRCHPEVRDALTDHRPIVALESTIFSTLGLPSPHNEEALHRCLNAIEERGATPALTALIEGVARVGLDPGEYERILGSARKTAARDLAPALAQAWPMGATTVSASLVLAASVGVTVFATGGIGGVHLGAASSYDVSADLSAIAAHQVITVCAGPKYFLDLAATLEVLETASVPVLGYRTTELPAFYSPHSGIDVPVVVRDPDEVARLGCAHWALGGGGVLLTVPIPDRAAIDRVVLDEVLARALDRAESQGITGAAITPLILAATAELTGGATVAANLALAEHNAGVAADVARALSDR